MSREQLTRELEQLAASMSRRFTVVDAARLGRIAAALGTAIAEEQNR